MGIRRAVVFGLGALWIAGSAIAGEVAMEERRDPEAPRILFTTLGQIDRDARILRGVTGISFADSEDYSIAASENHTVIRLERDGVTHSVVLRGISAVSLKRDGEAGMLDIDGDNPPWGDPEGLCCDECESYFSFSDDFETGGCVTGCANCLCELCVCRICDDSPEPGVSPRFIYSTGRAIQPVGRSFP